MGGGQILPLPFQSLSVVSEANSFTHYFIGNTLNKVKQINVRFSFLICVYVCVWGGGVCVTPNVCAHVNEH